MKDGPPAQEPALSAVEGTGYPQFETGKKELTLKGRVYLAYSSEDVLAFIAAIS